MKIQNRCVITINKEEIHIINSFINILENSPIPMDCTDYVNLIYKIVRNDPNINIEGIEIVYE